LVSDFGILIAICSLTLFTQLVHYQVPTLQVSDAVRPTMERGWLVDVSNIEHAGVALVAALPAAFYTILLVMDQQITSVIVNRKDNKLKVTLQSIINLLY
jgi:sodium bicarbonate transporter 10